MTVKIGAQNFTFEQFDADVDVDELLQIDFTNIVGEIALSAIYVNRIGQLKAEIKRKLAKAERDLMFYEAEQRTSIRDKLIKRGRLATTEEVNTELYINQGIRLKHQAVDQLRYELDVVDQLAWAVNRKDTNLNNFSRNITPKEFEGELVEKQIVRILAKK